MWFDLLLWTTLASQLICHLMSRIQRNSPIETGVNWDVFKIAESFSDNSWWMSFWHFEPINKALIQLLFLKLGIIVHNEAASFVPLLFTNWILTKRRRCSLRFAVSAKNPGRMVMTYCEQLALIDIEMRAGRWGSVSNGRAALLNSGRLSGMWSNASQAPAHTDQQIQAFLHSIGFDHSWTSGLCPSVETRRRNVSNVCFQFCLYSEEFGTNHFGHVKGMSDLSTFQFCNWFDNHFGPFVNCLPLLRPIAGGWFMQSDTGQFLIVQNIHPELLVCYLAVPSQLLVPLDSLHVLGWLSAKSCNLDVQMRGWKCLI